ncbi:hypothetical protein TWF696_007753 [Orbilia brochopaga]|uniref:Uncharacterized protein n=1 Tax=Orbilia brochopaga TaxID=3140254 RepID=A0AAV9US98_9PEZI
MADIGSNDLVFRLLIALGSLVVLILILTLVLCCIKRRRDGGRPVAFSALGAV